MLREFKLKAGKLPREFNEGKMTMRIEGVALVSGRNEQTASFEELPIDEKGVALAGVFPDDVLKVKVSYPDRRRRGQWGYSWMVQINDRKELVVIQYPGLTPALRARIAATTLPPATNPDRSTIDVRPEPEAIEQIEAQPRTPARKAFNMSAELLAMLDDDAQAA